MLLTATNIALLILAITLITLAAIVMRIWRTIHDFAALPSLEVSRARKRFMAQMEKRIREEANAKPGDPFPTLLLDMISGHHIEMDDLDARISKNMTDKVAGKSANK